MAAKRLKEGTLLRIDLANGTDAFARVLAQAQVAIYEKKVAHEEDVDFSSVYESKVLFKVTAMKSIFMTEKWKAVDYCPLEPELETPTEYFLKDKLTGRFLIYRSSDGDIREGTYQECKNLEAAAAWEPEHIESRIRDYFEGRLNDWVEQLRATP